MNQTYELIYLESFRKSFYSHIQQWETVYLISEEKITKFVTNIQTALEMLEYNPEMFQDVSKKYGFRKKTYRVLVGKYAIFYRYNKKRKIVYIGSMIHQSQMKVKF